MNVKKMDSKCRNTLRHIVYGVLTRGCLALLCAAICTLYATARQANFENGAADGNVKTEMQGYTENYTAAPLQGSVELLPPFETPTLPTDNSAPPPNGSISPPSPDNSMPPATGGMPSVPPDSSTPPLTGNMPSAPPDSSTPPPSTGSVPSVAPDTQIIPQLPDAGGLPLPPAPNFDLQGGQTTTYGPVPITGTDWIIPVSQAIVLLLGITFVSLYKKKQ